MRLAPSAAALAIAVAACELPVSPGKAPFGFTTISARAQLRLESRVRALTDRARIEAAHRELTRLPHPAGSARDRELADWTARQFTDAGMQDVLITTHDVMLPLPQHVSVTMTGPRAWRAPMHEAPVADPDTHIDPAHSGLPHHAYSASGSVEGAVVYAGYGLPRDYDWLAANAIDVRGKIVVVRHSRPYSYRGHKAYVAEQRGAAGILMYSDPADDGEGRGEVYPKGPWSPPDRIERGSVIYDFFAPGDPLTPGWPSVAGAKRLSRAEAASLPRIVSVPLSSLDARVILGTLGGKATPAAWHGGLPVPYNAGPGPALVGMTVRMDDGVRPVWTVTGMFRGAELPDEVIIVGNHRDAWVYGGVDPSSGSAALVEMARVIGSLTAAGWRPRRSILFASWDAEEYALTSSTEWGEQHQAWLRERAVAYINVDSAASGPAFVAGATPSLTRLLHEVSEAVDHPVLGVPIATVARDRATASGGDVAVIDDRLGGGSDYTVFLNFLGVPAADLAFDGPFGVGHSLYDTHGFVSRIADPGFRYHAALVDVWSLAALRLAQADALPLDPAAAAARILEYTQQARKRVADMPSAPALTGIVDAAAHLVNVAASFQRARETALAAGDAASLSVLNRQAIQFERAFVDANGLPGRNWYRHLIYAPRFTYEPQPLPGVNDAIDRRDFRLAAEQADRLVAALRRAAAQLDGW